VLFVFSTLLWLFAASGNKRLAVLFVFFDTFVAICCLGEQATRSALCFFRHFCGYLLPKMPQKEAANFGSFFFPKVLLLLTIGLKKQNFEILK
jgi:hypothetical protein